MRQGSRRAALPPLTLNTRAGCFTSIPADAKIGDKIAEKSCLANEKSACRRSFMAVLVLVAHMIVIARLVTVASAGTVDAAVRNC